MTKLFKAKCNEKLKKYVIKRVMHEFKKKQ